MIEVILFFPTNTQMAEFLSTDKITGAQADSGEQMLTGEPAYEEILAAETFYGAFLKKMTQEPNVRLSTQWYNTFSPVLNDIDQLLF